MKRLADLTSGDFVAHPVWAYFGTEDAQATVEPRPVHSISEADSGVWLAATGFRLADGTEAAGYCSPADASSLDYLQPVLFIGDRQVPLWRGLGLQATTEICRELGRTVEQVFPIAWRCLIPVDGEVRAGQVASTDVVAG